MDIDLLKQVLEMGGTYALLFMIVWYSLQKGIPYIIDKHNERLKEQDEVYKSSLREISTSFSSYMDKSMVWHQKHTTHLNEVQDAIHKVDDKIDFIIKK